MEVVDPERQRETEREGYMDTSEKERLKVAMVPWLAHGHISPYLELAKKLSQRNFDIYICSTPANLSPIKNRITETYSLSIHLVELHLSTEELPPHNHTTNGLPLHLIPTLINTFKKAKPDLANILNTLKPDLLIGDLTPRWARSVASRHKIPVLAFPVFSAAALSYALHFSMRRGIEFPFPAIRLTEYQLSNMFPERGESAGKDPIDDVDDGDDDDNDGNNDDQVILMNTSGVIEGKYLDYISALMKKQDVTPIGVLIRESNFGGDDDDSDDNELIEWLGRKEEYSTLFVAFGSEYYLKREEMEEIALGLEMSNVNFIWVIKAQKGEEMRVEESLPQGFVERVRERGKIVTKWVPQPKILSHSSVGGFVSHCGWNSVLESIGIGVPIIAIPMHLEQPVNAKVAVEFGVAAEVVRDENGRLQRDEISRVIIDVVVGERREIMRKRVEEVRESIRARSSEEMEGVVQKLRQLCGKGRREVLHRA